MDFDAGTVTALWAAVILSGVYHGVNPGMGWPLAVSSGLMEGRGRSLVKALGALAVGHLLAMLALLLPFSMLTVLVSWQTEIRAGAAGLVIAAGIYLLINRRHPRILARVAPSRLVLWSFLAATAHGAGLMLVPIYLGISGTDPGADAHAAARHLMGSNIGSALVVALAHTAAMMMAGGVLAAATYCYLGLRFVSRTWFNLDLVWALSLILVGLSALYFAITGH